jgi:hypothetical protein
MVYCLRRLTPAPIHSLNLVTDMTVVIFFRELCRGTIGSTADSENFKIDVAFIVQGRLADAR